jgi:suppressor for copper-sensitivity B
MNARRHLAFLGFAAALAVSGQAMAEAGASGWAGEPEGRARLLAAQDAAGPDGRLRLGVEIRLAPGWHTYWRDPGESGMPPAFDWSASENLASAELRWPAPRRFQAFGLDGYGWEGAVVFPVEARAARPAQPVRLRLKLDFQVCEEICIPVAAELALDLAAGEASPTSFAPLLERWAARVPGGAGLDILAVELAGAPGDEALQVRARSAVPFRVPDLFAEAEPPFRFAAPQMRLDGNEARFTLPVRAGRQKPSLAGRDVVLTLTDGERAAERRISLPARP